MGGYSAPVSIRRHATLRVYLELTFSLLYRYTLMYTPSSPVTLCKVQFNGSIALGLRATRDMAPGTFIMETCSSMSSDLVNRPGPSVIFSDAKQRGPLGSRLVLGPLRWANHDCKPNTQVSLPQSFVCRGSQRDSVLPYTRY